MKFSCNGSENCGIYQSFLENSTYNDIFYLSGEIKAFNEAQKVTIGLESIKYFRYRQTISNNWSLLSYVFKYDENIVSIVNSAPHAFVIYINSEFDYGLYLKNLKFIDLTLMFGEGNEPDKEWCDIYLTNYIEYNTEGTLTPIKEIGEPIKTNYYEMVSLEDE